MGGEREPGRQAAFNPVSKSGPPVAAGDPPSPRRVFREMIRLEASDRPLTWLERRALARFAEQLGIDGFEARLLIRAVEYECGHVPPAAMADVDTPVELGYAIEPEPWFRWMRFLVGVLVMLVIPVVWLWVRA